MRTKQEVINFLESKVGTKVPCPGNPSLDGQCVTLIKALMEFIGVPNPYKARGHASTCITTYLNEEIADKGLGFISVFSNKNMGSGYGHIWCNAGDDAGVFYEQNGVKPLIVTKGITYAYDNVCNFDKYIDSSEPESNNMLDCQSVLNHYNVKTTDELVGMVDSQIKFLEDERNKNNELEGKNRELQTQVESLEKQIGILNDELKILQESHWNQTIPIIEGFEANGLQVEMQTDYGKQIINYRRKD